MTCDAFAMLLRLGASSLISISQYLFREKLQKRYEKFPYKHKNTLNHKRNYVKISIL